MKLGSFEVIKLTQKQIITMCKGNNADTMVGLLGKSVWLIRGYFCDDKNKGFDFSFTVADPSVESFATVLRNCATKIIKENKKITQSG